MPASLLGLRRACSLVLLLAVSTAPAGAQGDGVTPQPLPSTETLHYNVEWRLFDAGTAVMKIERGKDAAHQLYDVSIQLQSAGVVSMLYKLNDTYKVHLEDQFCATNSSMDSFEGKKHHETKVTYDRARNRAIHVDRDLLKNGNSTTKEIDILPCTSDVIGGLYKLRGMHLEPGQSVLIPTSDGKKTAQVRIEAQQREEVRNHMGVFRTIRYEAYLFNGVIYSKNAHIQVWITDDARRLPVQIRARMSFPIGSITLALEKEEHS